MSAVTYEIKVDWDMIDWSDTPDFSQSIDDISGDVKSIRISRGKDKELGNAPSGTLELILDNSSRKYSPVNSNSPLYGKMLPWRIIRVRAFHDGNAYNLYMGYISKYSISPHWTRKESYIYATDGMDLIARQLIAQDTANPNAVSEKSAIDRVLNAAGWSSSKRIIDTDGGDVKYPICSEY